jgi:hypothetical protein
MYQRFFDRENQELCKYMTRQSIKDPSHSTNQLGTKNRSLAIPQETTADNMTTTRNSASSSPRAVEDSDRVLHDDPMSFPQKLHRILSLDTFNKDAITWMPHGRCFRVLNPQLLEEKVLPNFFGHPSYFNFLDKLDAFGFVKIPRGKDFDCFYHEVRMHVCMYDFFCVASIFWIFLILVPHYFCSLCTMIRYCTHSC